MRHPETVVRRRDATPGFGTLAFGRTVLNLKYELMAQAPAIANRLLEWRASGAVGAGNRGSGFRISIPGLPELFARIARRGGWMRYFSRETFLGLRPRQLDELRVADAAYRRGVPIAEPMGAMAKWIVPGVYRGFFISRAIDGMSLWEFVRIEDDPLVRRHVLEHTRAAIEMMHQLGVAHADLNLHNLFVTHHRDEFAVLILDLDKARLFGGSVPAPIRRATHARLLRSIRKLDPDGRWFDSEALEFLRTT
jgi:hypothetical protein